VNEYRWGPGRKRAALSVTFDNLGEAADIAIGRCPPGHSLGRHFTADRVVPDLLKEIRGVNITYFVEAVNSLLYPEVLKAVRDAGHEVALHAWAHENWQGLNLQQQADNLQMSLEALAKIGIEPRGFRPPGGAISPESLAVLRKTGFTYCSPLSDMPTGRVENEFAILPFQWRHVDAYLLEPKLSARRVSNGDPEAPLDPESWAGILAMAVDRAVATGQHLTVIFHPYVLGGDFRLVNILKEFLAQACSRDDLWVAPALEVANWVSKSNCE
jgi:peptidoglycan-N-acetylglucosamine deacetylase